MDETKELKDLSSEERILLQGIIQHAFNEQYGNILKDMFGGMTEETQQLTKKVMGELYMKFYNKFINEIVEKLANKHEEGIDIYDGYGNVQLSYRGSDSDQ